MAASFLSPEIGSVLTAALRENSPGHGAVEAHLAAALNEATSHPGRLLRARLIYTALLQHGTDDMAARQFACAIEYYHVASLLLDDLPCMDDATVRRGRECVHRVHGDATAILAALALINRAYALIGFALADQPFGLRLRATACLDAALGTAGIVGGQARDLRYGEGRPSAQEVAAIALGKTGALFTLSVYLPALFAQPGETERHLLKALCVYWGIAYQAADDLQDVLSNSAVAGKSTGRDRALARPNLVAAVGVGEARRRLDRLAGLAERTLARLRALDPRWAYLGEFQDVVFATLLARQTAA